MKLKKGSFADFSQRIKATGKKVIVYGAGVIGRTAAPYWLREYQLEEDVLCYVDADACKQGQTVKVGFRDIFVRPLSMLDEEKGKYILLITVSAFFPIVQSLKQIPGTVEAEAYFLPIMLLDAAHTPKRDEVIRTSGTPLIPRRIHYCWFGRNPIPAELQTCIETWKRFCPDYEIIRWDESNYDVTGIPYIEQAYRCKRWSFVTDVARLDILCRHGGIYLDTDVELLRGLDELLYQPAFCATEKWGISNSGGGLGAEAGNEAVRSMLDFRKKFTFLSEDGRPNLMSSGYFETTALISMGMRPNGRTQQIAGGRMIVYSPEFFHPFDYMSGRTVVTENTFSIHHFSGMWLGENAAAERRTTRKRYQEFISKLEA